MTGVCSCDVVTPLVTWLVVTSSVVNGDVVSGSSPVVTLEDVTAPVETGLDVVTDPLVTFPVVNLPEVALPLVTTLQRGLAVVKAAANPGN